MCIFDFSGTFDLSGPKRISPTTVLHINSAMPIDAFEAGCIQQHYRLHHNISRAARELHHARSTIRRALALQPRSVHRSPRHTPKHIVQRRKAVARYAAQVTRRGHRAFPRHGSSEAIAYAVTHLSHIKCSARTVLRDLRSLGLVTRVRPTVPARYSPDFSPIETAWADVHRAIGRALSPLTEEELLAAANKAWKELHQALIDRHVLPFGRRVRAFVATAR